MGIRQYREAYDILSHIAPANESEMRNLEIRVEWVKPMEGYEEPYINVYNCEGGLWEHNVAKEVVVSDDCKLTKEEVIAKILWSCTFYGYTPQTLKDTFEDRIEHKMHTSYGTMARKLEQKLYFNYLPGRKKREILETMKLASHDSISMSMEDWDYCNRRISQASNIKRSVTIAWRSELIISIIEKSMKLSERSSWVVKIFPSMTWTSSMMVSLCCKPTWRLIPMEKSAEWIT
ncbi:MAG: hypothetical protein ACLRYB_05635 [Segatella copri]